MTRTVFYLLALTVAYIAMAQSGQDDAALWLLGAIGTLLLVWEGLRAA